MKFPLPLVKTKRGCSQLTYLLANNLKKISWPAVEPKKYMGLMASFITLNTVMCPKDSGFLMVLKYLPRLRLLLNEKGGKIIETLMAERSRLKVRMIFSGFKQYAGKVVRFLCSFSKRSVQVTRQKWKPGW